MQLTVFTDYTLRTLMYLAAHPGEVVPASAISDAHGVSPDHIAKAAKWLTQKGYVRAHRGQHGGISLARSPKTIRLGAIVRATEPHLNLLECFNAATNTCRLSPACRLKQALQRACAAFLAVLDEYTLEDLVDNGPELLKLLGRDVK